jgi:hypothetical protein
MPTIYVVATQDDQDEPVIFRKAFEDKQTAIDYGALTYGSLCSVDSVELVGGVIDYGLVDRYQTIIRVHDKVYDNAINAIERYDETFRVLPQANDFSVYVARTYGAKAGHVVSLGPDKKHVESDAAIVRGYLELDRFLPLRPMPQGSFYTTEATAREGEYARHVYDLASVFHTLYFNRVYMGIHAKEKPPVELRYAYDISFCTAKNNVGSDWHSIGRLNLGVEPRMSAKQVEAYLTDLYNTYINTHEVSMTKYGVRKEQ